MRRDGLLDLEKQLAELTKRIAEEKARRKNEFLAEDMQLESAVKDLAKAYAARDWMRMKNAAATIMTSHYDEVPEMPDAESEFDEIINSGIGYSFPDEWSIPKEIMMPTGLMTVFKAKQKTGKSRAMLSVMLAMAKKNLCVSIMSSEMPTAQVWLNLFMQHQYLERKVSYSEFEARLALKSDHVKWTEVREAIKRFRKDFDKNIFVLHTPGWTARRLVYGARLGENHFGKKPHFWGIDYAQIIEGEPSIRDMRQQHIFNSLYLTKTMKYEKIGGIVVSQQSESGATAESQQYEKDAGMVVALTRETDKDTGKKSPQVEIFVEHSRSTESGKFQRFMDVKSGAIVFDNLYLPPSDRATYHDSLS